MVTYFFRRLLGAIPTIFLIILISFFLIRLAPGGPFDFDRTLAPEIQANLNAQYHLDKPIYVQFGYYFVDILHGDFGPSYQYKNYTVTELIAQGFPVSLQIGLSAMVLALLIGVAAGMFAAYKQNSRLDHLVMTLSMTGISIPNFVVAPLLILIFAIGFSLLPAGGWNNGAMQNQILPIITLALPLIAYIARISRSSMIEVLRMPYIRTAYSKGLPSFYILTRHALKPMLLPVISYLGPAIAGLITGSVVVEQIYGIPGLGRYFIQGALNRDYTLVMGVVVFYGILIIALNLLVDLLYGWLDPQIRLQGRTDVR